MNSTQATFDNNHNHSTHLEHPDDTAGGGTIRNMQDKLYALGYERAKSSGTRESQEADVRALEDHAQGEARDTSRASFDPAQHIHDRMYQEEFEKDLKDRDEVEKSEAYARANLREAELSLAKTTRGGEKPGISSWLMAAFIVAITITVAPTLHDFVFHTIADDLLAWFAATSSSGFVGAMLTLAILTGRRSSWTWIGTAAGVVLGIGLGALRLSSAEGTGEVIFAVGLTVIEIAEVLLLEWLATSIRHKENTWEQTKTIEDQAINLRDAEQATLVRWQRKHEALDKSIASKISYVEDRNDRSMPLPELEAVAVKAAIDGYNAGVAYNVGLIRGAIRRIS